MSVYYLLLPTVGVAADINTEELVRMAVFKRRKILEKYIQRNSWSANKLPINLHVCVILKRFVYMQHILGGLTGI